MNLGLVLYDSPDATTVSMAVHPEASKVKEDARMPIITEDSNLFTEIVMFTVAPEQQQELVNAIVSEVKRWVRHCPGFVSVNFHSIRESIYQTSQVFATKPIIVGLVARKCQESKSRSAKERW